MPGVQDRMWLCSDSPSQNPPTAPNGKIKENPVFEHGLFIGLQKQKQAALLSDADAGN